MTAQKARIGSVVGGALTVLGLASLVGGLSHASCFLVAFLGLPVKTLWEALPPVILAAWHFLEPCPLSYSSLLDGVLQVSLYCGHFVLAFAAVA